MANISSYLAAIMSAVYGEDVRGSIHDAIDIINQVGEVVLNTGTAVTGPTSSSTGFFDGSFYINTNTMELWKCIGTNSWQSQGVLKGADGADGNGITKIEKTATVGLVDTYTITYDDGGTETYQVTNGQNGSKWYKGTAISGTGTSITGFPGVLNDFYLNSIDGYVYTCTKTGGSLPPDAAEWDYVMTLTGGGGTSVTVVDNLISTSSTDALSANQGRVLNEGKQAKYSSYGPGLKETNPTPTTLQLSLDLLAGSNISLTPTMSGQLQISASGGGGGSSTFAGLDDTDITNVQPDQIVQYKSVGGELKLQNVAMPQGTLTISQNGTTKGTFTANQSTNTSASIVTDEWTTEEHTLAVGDTTATFSGLNTSYAYKPFIQVADGETAPTGTMTFSGTTATVTFTAITNAQATGGAAKIKLRIIK